MDCSNRGDCRSELNKPAAEKPRVPVTALIERYATGLSVKILGAVFSLADLERENPNLFGGDRLSGSHHLDQNFVFRPVFGWSTYKTPAKGLYVVSSATWLGAGVGAGSGFILALILAGDPPHRQLSPKETSRTVAATLKRRGLPHLSTLTAGAGQANARRLPACEG
jgi:hypothetical protein